MNIECNPQILFACLILLIFAIIFSFILGRMEKHKDFRKRVEEAVNSRMNTVHGFRKIMLDEEQLEIETVNADANVPSHVPFDHVKKHLAESLGNYILENKLFMYYNHVEQQHHNETFHQVSIKIVKPNKKNTEQCHELRK